MLFSLALLAASVLSASALNPIVRDGSFLFDSVSGERFYLKGVAYAENYGSSQATTVEESGTVSALDPLANGDGCTRDVTYFKELDVNVIRVYQVNASLDHSTCMEALDAAGVYVLLDLATPAAALDPTSPSWDLQLMTDYITTIEAFGSYSNVLGFNIGNEVINNVEDDQAAPYIKAAVRDIKTYLSAHNYSQLVGYTATDSPNSRVTLPYYLACDEESSAIFDYWGLNIYEWCGDSTFQTSGYQARTEELATLGIPAFFSEYGCNSVEPRTFEDVPVLYSSDMTDVWSGGVIYEYIQQGNDYGLVNISSDGDSVTTLTDFNNLKSYYTSVTGSSLNKASYTASVTLPDACPTSNSTWPVATALPPTPNSGECDCVANALTCISTYSLDDTDIGTALGEICGTSSEACASVSGNGTTGTYGDLSMCNALQRLNIAMDVYFNLQSRSASACKWSFATTATNSYSNSAAAASATSSCIAADAFVASTGIPSATTTLSGATTKSLVTTTAQSTGKSSSSSGSGSSSSGSSSGAIPIFGDAPMNVLFFTMIAGLVAGALAVVPM
ncbi:carbohydrate-binding module family 43 protein [Laetiporus sulphureus 93-53]|uniref:1,3-beta-glucanosyltransferase n=1 Tax=Laetiporus sulphureus 93-53 TaxID=1314785 RepID=A0A165EIV5_9APHY|nr:carbohydrate-binding module family 43 protein [Laetiporus sulphureus 93-53]KZT07141.1 carbohydrate-binding module family 43 protein [Laetiporus sulphureus 93-53]